MVDNNNKDERLLRKLNSEMGPVVLAALSDPAVIEIMLNADGKIWVERFGQGMQVQGDMTPANAMALMGTIADALHTTVTRENPILEGELPGSGARFEGVVPPVTTAPAFAIRKKATMVFNLSDYEASGAMTTPQKNAIQSAIANRLNILVVGGTGSGKTTLTNAVIAGIAETHPHDRLVIIEDTAEIQCTAQNAQILRATVDVSMQALLRATMRLRPDRILVGEVRGAEALALLKAWNTGHPGGVATLHANDARGGLTRLEQLVSENGLIQGVPALIGAAVGLVVVISKDVKCAAGRRVTELVEVQGWNGSYLLRDVSN